MGTSIYLYRGSLLVLNAVTRNMSLLPRSSGDMTAIFLPCKNSKFPLSLRLRYCPFSTTSARSCTNSLAFIPCSSLRDRMCCSPQVSSPHIRSIMECALDVSSLFVHEFVNSLLPLYSLEFFPKKAPRCLPAVRCYVFLRLPQTSRRHLFFRVSRARSMPRLNCRRRCSLVLSPLCGKRVPRAYLYNPPMS